MPSVVLHRLAEEVLTQLAEDDSQNYQRIRHALNELETRGFQESNLKRVSSGHKIFRKRVGRYRILFTSDGDTFHVWIIDMKKDRRDYIRWIMYIHMQE